MIALLVVFVIFLLGVYFQYSDRRFRLVNNNFPGPICLPFIGNLYIAIGLSREDIMKFVISFPKKYNYKPFRLWTHERPVVMITDCENAKLVLSSFTQIDKSLEYKYVEPWIGQGIITGTGEKWKKHRKLITPAFHFKILHKFFKIFDANADTLCQILANHEGKEAFDVYKYVTLYALDNICDSSMGVSVNALHNPNSEYVTSVKKMNAIVLIRAMVPWLRSELTYKYTSTYRLQEKVLGILHGHNSKVIEQRKKGFDCNGNLINKDQEEYIKEKPAFLDTLLACAQDEHLTDKEIREEVDAIMFAGHDTITSALSFLLYALADHQDIQEKVYEELQFIFGSSDRCPEYNDLQEMKYLEQTIKETLRYYTVAPVIGRTFNEDFVLSEGQIVPKGAEVCIMIAAVHKNPNTWHNPDVFDPDRFSPEACQNRHPFAFIPFSAGPRNCIGQKFAMFQLKITVCKILRKFKLILSDDPKDKIRPHFGMIVTSANGMMIRIQSRHRNNGL